MVINFRGIDSCGYNASTFKRIHKNNGIIIAILDNKIQNKTYSKSDHSTSNFFGWSKEGRLGATLEASGEVNRSS